MWPEPTVTIGECACFLFLPLVGEIFFFTLHIPYEYEVQRMLDGKPFELNRIVASVFDGGGALVGMSASFVSLTGTDDGIIMKMHEKRKHLK